MARRDSQASGTTPRSPLEWIAAGFGLLVAAAMAGFIGWGAYSRGDSAPPAISVVPQRVVETSAGYVVEVKATNASEQTGAAVLIEGELKEGGASVEKSQATISYVPGRSERTAGLVFRRDPRRLQLEVRTLGYEKP